MSNGVGLTENPLFTQLMDEIMKVTSMSFDESGRGKRVPIKITSKAKKIVEKSLDDNDKLLMLRKARAVGITTLLAGLTAAHMRIDNNGILFVAPKMVMCREFENTVKQAVLDMAGGDVPENGMNRYVANNLSLVYSRDSLEKAIFGRKTNDMLIIIDEAEFISWMDLEELIKILGGIGKIIVSSTPTKSDTYFCHEWNSERTIKPSWFKRLFKRAKSYTERVNDCVKVTWEDCPWVWRNGLGFEKGDFYIIVEDGKLDEESFQELKELGWEPRIASANEFYRSGNKHMIKREIEAEPWT